MRIIIFMYMYLLSSKLARNWNFLLCRNYTTSSCAVLVSRNFMNEWRKKKREFVLPHGVHFFFFWKKKCTLSLLSRHLHAYEKNVKAIELELIQRRILFFLWHFRLFFVTFISLAHSQWTLWHGIGCMYT